MVNYSGEAIQSRSSRSTVPNNRQRAHGRGATAWLTSALCASMQHFTAFSRMPGTALAKPDPTASAAIDECNTTRLLASWRRRNGCTQVSQSPVHNGREGMESKRRERFSSHCGAYPIRLGVCSILLNSALRSSIGEDRTPAHTRRQRAAGSRGHTFGCGPLPFVARRFNAHVGKEMSVPRNPDNLYCTECYNNA